MSSTDDLIRRLRDWRPDDGGASLLLEDAVQALGLLAETVVRLTADVVRLADERDAVRDATIEECARVAEATQEFGLPSGSWVYGARTAAVLRGMKEGQT